MKRILIVLLSVLLVFSFSSCEKDKSEEVIAVYEDYWKTSAIIGNVSGIPGYTVPGEGSNKVNATVSKDTLRYESNLQDYLELVGVEGKVDSITDASGSITGTYDSNQVMDLTYNDVVITYKMTGDDAEHKLTFSGTQKFQITDDVQTGEFKFTVNGTVYSYSTKADLKAVKYISVSVNGKDVDVRLLNGLLYIRSKT